jgi:DNA-binding MarR family transcriptional regulator
MQNLSKYRLAGTMDATPSGKLLFMILMDLIDMNNAVVIPQKRISETLGLSKGTVNRTLRKLEKHGYIGITAQYHSDGGRAANKYYIK